MPTRRYRIKRKHRHALVYQPPHRRAGHGRQASVAPAEQAFLA